MPSPFISAFDPRAVLPFNRDPARAAGPRSEVPPERGSVGKTAQCALVIEDNPLNADGRLTFDSFPEDFEEQYQVQYREIGGDRMPQPIFASYKGGDWGPFPLKLIFRAGMKGFGLQNIRSPSSGLGDVDVALLEMEDKVRWCQALAFPLERTASSVRARIQGRAKEAGISESLIAESSAALGKIKRVDPPIVLIVLGSWMVVRGYITATSIKWLPPFHPVSARPFGAEVNLTFKPLMADWPTFATIRGLAGSGGFTTDMQTSQELGDFAKAAAKERTRTALRAQENAAASAGLREQAAIFARARAGLGG